MEPMAVELSGFRRYVSRACTVCEWEGQAVEPPVETTGCPWCHAPARIVGEALLVPIVAGKNPLAAVLSRAGAALGGRARAQRLSPARRREIASAAARARWRTK